MQLELKCSECQNEFESASALLRHFAIHVKAKNKKLPELHPLNIKSKPPSEEDPMETGIVVDDVNPVRFCLVTMEDDSKNLTTFTQNKSFQCTDCNMTFSRDTYRLRHQKKMHGKIPDLRPIEKEDFRLVFT